MKKPTSQSVHYCWMKGNVIPLAKASLPIMDIAVLRGYGVFDSMLAVGDRVLHEDQHLKRFFASAKSANIAIRFTKTDILAGIRAVLRKNKFPQAKVRIVATGGETIRSGLEFNSATAALFIIAEPYTEAASSVYEKGVTLMTAEYQRPMPHAKTTNYMLAVNLQQEKKRKKAFEILYTFNGRVYECTTSNFFIVKNNQLITADTGILKGITRRFVLDSAKHVGLHAVERTVTLKDVADADEAFITATYKGVVPVVKIDDMVIGNGRVGHAAQELQKLYQAFSL